MSLSSILPAHFEVRLTIYSTEIQCMCDLAWMAVLDGPRGCVECMHMSDLHLFYLENAVIVTLTFTYRSILVCIDMLKC